MSLNLSNFKKNLPANLIKAAGSHRIRECEESEKGKFVAFAEDGKQDFDVGISLSDKGDIKEHQCDCGSALPFCSHKAALLIHLSTGNLSPKKQKKPGTRRNETDVLLEGLSENELKTWLSEILKEKKDLALQFKNRFKPAQTSFTRAEVRSLSRDVVKSVINTRKSADKAECKKIASLWRQVQRPVLDYYFSDPADSARFEALACLLETIISYDNSLNRNHSEITNYVQSVITETEDHLRGSSDDVWEKYLRNYLLEIENPEAKLNYFFLVRLLKISGTLPETRKTPFIKLIAHAAIKCWRRASHHKRKFQTVLINYLSIENGLFEHFFENFETIPFYLEYNTILIDRCIRIKQYALAEKMCQEALKSSGYDDNNIVIYQYLELIYSETGNSDNLIKIKRQLLPFTFSIKDYIAVLPTLRNLEEAQKFRDRLVSKARNALTPESGEFLFELAVYEGDYKKLLKYINAYTSFEKIMPYWDILLRTSQKDFLRVLLNSANLYISPGEEKAYLRSCATVMEKMLKTIDPAIIKWAVKSYSDGSNDYPFIDYLKKNLPK